MFHFNILILEARQSAGKIFCSMSLYISDEYLSGFIDGEGCFYVGIVPAKEVKLGWQVIPFFKVSQNPAGKVILDGLKKRLDCGYIKRNDNQKSSDKSLAFVVRNFNDLITKVIPTFNGKLIIKRNSFNKFKKIIEYIQLKKHLNVQGLKEIIEIAYSMNTQKRKVSKESLIEQLQEKSSQTIRQIPI